MAAHCGSKFKGVFAGSILFFILALASNAFSAGSPFAGVYMGTSGGPAPACEPGQFAIIVQEDGTFNLLAHADLGADDFLTNFVKEGLVIAGDGSFATSATIFDGEDSLNVLINGTFAPPLVSGTYSDDSGCSGTFSGNKVTFAGPLLKAGGYYTGTTNGTLTLNGLPLGTFSGTVTAIVAADGSGMMVHNVVFVVPGEPDDPLTIGGPISVDPAGNFNAVLDEFTVTGSFDTTNFTGSGTTSAVFIEVEGTFVESGTFTLARQLPLIFPDNDVVASLPGTGVVVLFNDNASSVTLDPDAAEGLSIGDFDNSGEDDVIARFADGDGPTNSGGAWISENQGALTLLGPLAPEQVAVGNFDGVAGDDRFLSNVNGLFLILNGGPSVPVTTLQPVAMASGDVDGNGQDDVVLSFSSIGTIVFRNLSVVDALDSTPADELELGDLDGNGQDDIFASFAPGNGPGGTGGLSFSVNQGALTSLTPLETLNMTSGDFDGSGQDDFLLDFGGATGLVLLLNGATVTPLGVLPVVAMASGDVDSNGEDDMILSIPGTGTIAFKNLATVEVLSPTVALDLATGNVDGN